MSDIYQDAQTAVAECAAWAEKTALLTGCQLYLFGSAIYKGGEQFDRVTSDVDIVAIIADQTAPKRVDVLQKLAIQKAHLELQLIPKLGRIVANEPTVSVVPVTQLEIEANIHKSGARRFFDKNIFLNLYTLDERVGLPSAGIYGIPDENRQALEICQQTRNTYLSIAANGSGGLPAYDGSDPIPKHLLRAASQLESDKADGEWYDTRLGLEFLFEKLRLAAKNAEYKALFEKISVRRNGRGRVSPLSGDDQLLISELLYDLASSAEKTNVVTWQATVPGAFSEEKGHQIFKKMSSFLREIKLIKIMRGSTVLFVSSPESSAEAAELLATSGVLGRLVGAEEISVARMTEGESTATQVRGDPLLSYLKNWKPIVVNTESDLEQLLYEYLSDFSDAGREFEVRRDAKPKGAARGTTIDFSISPRDHGEPRLLIELMRVRSGNEFFSRLGRIIDASSEAVPIVLMLVGSERLLNKLREDIDRLLAAAPYVVIFPISSGG